MADSLELRRLRTPTASWSPTPMRTLSWWTCCGLTPRVPWPKPCGVSGKMMFSGVENGGKKLVYT